ncbi:MAG TPA: DUF2341 domain-containing protein, partial [Candidatus Methylomirabilis sp.]|nr:DUF2341 domain-containing protein [Candidatus Methylomirabilis sp.]
MSLKRLIRQRRRYFFAGLAVAAAAALVFVLFFLPGTAAPANPSSLQQYGPSTSTAITNGAWVTNNTVNLQATSSDATYPFTVFYQLIPSGSAFTTATSAPASFCKNNSAYSSCLNNIWANAVGTPGWFDPDYPFRIALTIPSTKISGALSSFPVYFDLRRLGTGSNNFWAHTKRNSDGGDLIVTDSNNNQLPLEVAAISTSTKTGEIYFKASSISSSSNPVFYLYYGSSTARQVASSTTYGARNVWDSNYAAVWHMGQAQGVPIKDSTSNGNLSTLSSAPTATTGCKLGNCLTFNGTSNYITVANSASLLSPKTQLTLSAWFNTTSGGGGQKIVGKVDSGVSRGYV